MIHRVRGTRDILDMRLFDFAISTISVHLKRYHFSHIMTPILEPIELFKRSLGTETDVVSKEMFVVTSSSGQADDSICLRPEATASTIRAFVEEGVQQTPWKVFTHGSMFRYERPQKGRFREFHQVSLECIGSSSVAQDAQLIAMLDRLFSQAFHLESYALHINFLGTPEERATFRTTFLSFLDGQPGLCETCMVRKTTNVLRVLDCKQEACRAICKAAPTLEAVFGEASKTEWQSLKNYLEELSVSFTVNSRLVRGLDYYNKTVFEFVSADLGSQSAFCGGGRYDFLVSHIGGKEDQPSIGAAIGIDRLLMLLESCQDSLPLAQEPALYVIIPVAQEQHGISLQIADALLESGLTVEALFDGSLKSMMRKANKLGARYCIVVGQTEQQEGTAVLKDMKSGDEQTVKQTDLPKILK